MQDGIGDLQKVDLFISSAQDMEDELEMLGLKVKYHEDNVRYLKNRMNAVDRVVFDLQGSAP
ncbi:hypothetical protein ZOSMA_148G00250 [Zostera marina]|uniref:Uncharacterized protein n=1 Tax=Zostera marina TaxID=29655 RepID=A0A0K9PWR9_ZOSMR|nr:hypothetical protein ZOSMA_148G00250 [Zostera marina]